MLYIGLAILGALGAIIASAVCVEILVLLDLYFSRHDDPHLTHPMPGGKDECEE